MLESAAQLSSQTKFNDKLRAIYSVLAKVSGVAEDGPIQLSRFVECLQMLAPKESGEDGTELRGSLDALLRKQGRDDAADMTISFEDLTGMVNKAFGGTESAQSALSLGPP